MGKKITLEEMKTIQVSMMKQIDKICKDNNLTYSLLGGSLLGAVRHQGFIPWDDDIDIMLPRPDYDKLKSILLNDKDSNLKFMDCTTQDDCYYVYGKIIDKRTVLQEKDVYPIKNYGVFIDVFPIDGLPNNDKEKYKLMDKIGRLRTYRKFAIHTNLSKKNKIVNILYKVLSIPIKIYGYKRINKKAYNLLKSNSYEDSKYVIIIYDNIAIQKHKFYEKNFFEKVHYTKFEDTNLLIIDEYDKYLTDLFGDYMQLPPIDKRISNHSFDKLEWKDDIK